MKKVTVTGWGVYSIYDEVSYAHHIRFALSTPSKAACQKASREVRKPVMYKMLGILPKDSSGPQAFEFSGTPFII